ncbi:hypothetical protein CP980_28285 [Streptomyces vinaceus]|uniref:DUF8017 domain-containing protein n=1 Tax=Streptomyces vinaceus TaxID=1960 RepID=A0A5J6JFN4_STRVI|nr:hypothetical protein [Streptomyces vinaceus]QEV48462.1 hypothetical protein CP980_28285 [Streptomyces vinaceus]GHE74326.1 hypothetical protein GCM10017778_69800 [Streptomyces vinaceus]
MWPGQQQPPGGQQNPQDAHQNPYQQQGQPGQAGQQPNPYQQQPGYGYPQAGYQLQPPTQPWGQPQQPQTAPQRGGGGSPYATKTVAIVAAAAVIVVAAATGAFVLTRDDKKNDEADGKPAASSSAPATAQAPASPGANPRAGGEVKPVVPGWKVVVNPKHGTAFDVPPEWDVSSSGVIAGFEDATKKDGSPIVSFSAPAFFKKDWCKVDSDKDGREETSELAGTGTKGGQGAKDTAEAVKNEAGNWVFAAFAQKAPKGTVKVSDPKEYTTTSGLKGHMATATAIGVPKENKCSSDGKSIAFSFKTSNGDFASWVLFAASGVQGEVPQETMDKILSSVRLNGTPSNS